MKREKKKRRRRGSIMGIKSAGSSSKHGKERKADKWPASWHHQYGVAW